MADLFIPLKDSSMHSSTEASSFIRRPVSQTPFPELTLVERGENRGALIHFWAAVVMCEVVVDFLTIIAGLLVSHVLCDRFTLAKQLSLSAQGDIGQCIAGLLSSWSSC